MQETPFDPNHHCHVGLSHSKPSFPLSQALDGADEGIKIYQDVGQSLWHSLEHRVRSKTDLCKIVHQQCTPSKLKPWWCDIRGHVGGHDCEGMHLGWCLWVITYHRHRAINLFFDAFFWGGISMRSTFFAKIVLTFPVISWTSFLPAVYVDDRSLHLSETGHEILRIKWWNWNGNLQLSPSA